MQLWIIGEQGSQIAVNCQMTISTNRLYAPAVDVLGNDGSQSGLFQANIKPHRAAEQGHHGIGVRAVLLALREGSVEQWELVAHSEFVESGAC